MTRNPLLAVLKGGIATHRSVCPDLSDAALGLPKVTESPCEGSGCRRCVGVCPTRAITVAYDELGAIVALDRGRCIGCNACLESCPSGTLAPDRSTRTATRTREALVLTNRPKLNIVTAPSPRPFLRSLHIREVSTGCNATDQEVAAATNPIFDVARFGVHFVASPRYADALLVTGPVGRAMHEPLQRCFDAMAEPRIVIAVGTCAISGGLHADGYADANGVDNSYPIAAYVPGSPPHPWSIIHGILLAMGRETTLP
ncbi:MAG: 4Fe-4S dicluster domain-containing protein [Armatimonadetes bacterium]|nr:4Fe-4S dicluster domain-containing protein [Armatimonadota bacterium]